MGWSGLLAVLMVGVHLHADELFLDKPFQFGKKANVVYGTGDCGYPVVTGKLNLSLNIYYPTGNIPNYLPGMVFIHGGGFTNGTKDDVDIVNFCTNYAARGYVTVSINYRLQQDNPAAEPGPMPTLVALGRAVNAAAQDAAKTIRWLKANAATYRVDTNRMVVGGGSAGSTTAMLAAYQSASVIGSNTAVNAVIDCWGSLSGNETLITATSPPICIYHGDADTIDPISNSYAITNQCGQVGLPYLFMPIPGAGHSCWSDIWNGTVNGKTRDRWGAEFLYDQLNLAGLATNTLTVISGLGQTVPPVGVNYFPAASLVTNSVVTPVVIGTSQYTCMGWSMTGSTPASGPSQSFVMTLTNNATLTWLWQTNPWVNLEASGNYIQ